MIRIRKSTTAPHILENAGKIVTAEICRLYNQNPTAYNTGKEKLPIDNGIYGYSSVKTQLQLDQHEKCCFCEADFTANGYGDVEHFRPKAGYRDTPQGKLNRSGYYWLTYDWQNLYFSCQICNQQYKKNFFPLENESNRARNHTDNIDSEEAQLIHPGVDDPDKHLEFRQHIVVHKTVKGQKSIQAYGLARPKINKAREKYFQDVRKNIALAGVDLESVSQEDKIAVSRFFNIPWIELEDLIRLAKEFVPVAATDQKPFALMVRQNFPHLSYESQSRV